MASNDFLIFDPTSTNIISQATYSAETRRTNGFATGIVPSNLFNKILRQASAMASMLGLMSLTATGQNVVDDGTTATLLTNFTNAQKALSQRYRPITSRASATTIGITGSSGSGGIWLGSALTKSTAGAWVAGTGNGMGNGLTIANATWYHVFLVTVSGVNDVYFDTSISAANAPTGTTASCRIGSFLTNGSAQILAYTQVAQTFLWGSGSLTQDFNTTTLSTTTASLTAKVPTGVNVYAKVRGYFTHASVNTLGLINSPLEGAVAVNTPTGNLNVNVQLAAAALGFDLEIMTNTSGQVQAVSAASNTTLQGTTYGWIDPSI